MRILLGLALVAAWSSGFIGAELGTRSAPAVTLLAWRYVVATAAFALLLLVLRRRLPRRNLGPAGRGRRCSARACTSAASWAASASASHPVRRRSSRPGNRWWSRSSSTSCSAARPPGRSGWAWPSAWPASRWWCPPTSGAATAPAWAYLLPVVGMLGLSLGTVLDRRWDLDDGVLEALTVQTARRGGADGRRRRDDRDPDAAGHHGVLDGRRLGRRPLHVRRLRPLLLGAAPIGSHRRQHLALPHPAGHDALGRAGLRRPTRPARHRRDGRLRGRGLPRRGYIHPSPADDEWASSPTRAAPPRS